MYDKIILLAVGGVVALGTVLYYIFSEKEEPQRTGRGYPGNTHSSSRRRSPSPPMSYSDIQPGSCRYRNPGRNTEKTRFSDINPTHQNINTQEIADPTPVSEDIANLISVSEDIANPISDDNGEPIPVSENIADSASVSEDIVDLTPASEDIADSTPISEVNADSISEINDPVHVHEEVGAPNTTSQDFPTPASISEKCEVCELPADATLYPCKHKVFCCDHAQYYFDTAKKYQIKPKCPSRNCLKEIEYFIQLNTQ